MSLVMKISIGLSMVVLALGTVACDFSPTAPFPGFDGQASQETVGTEGATLHGTFTGSGGSSNALRAFAASTTDDLIVIVYVLEGTERKEIGRVQVVGGSFTIRGLPEYFILEFWDPNAEGGNTMVGKYTFEGVKPNQELDIVLAYDGKAVDLLEERRTGINHEPGDGIELEGPVESIDREDDPMTGTLRVNTWRVETERFKTSIRKGNRSLTLANIQVGDRVHVRGVVEEDEVGRYVFAHEIKLQEEAEDDTGEATNCPEDPAKPGHILICHNGKVLSVSKDAWPDHQGHGDKCAGKNTTPNTPCGS